ncbi:hypothetical protein ACEP28_32610 [Pseudomonas aeruginosa]|jgi:hypothetical protein|uniref:hypothetical protein n=1 Tax=Pseudomonadaceae TaxID=135621 RepID=UPI000B5A82EB|nr:MULTISPECIES: hypothetical protein [Pseudomonas aeruginosa group]ASJ88809.1 hypothetical protein PSA83_06683 [Pseudomonas aeruginosa]MBO8337146.1 hypothetical protein [Pseudomonas aeruginosa]BDC78376.1 hypothetical protein MRCP2_p1110 [Pseudomonas alcaligenes]HCF4080826.1 hypothetical protein [Pseudomonas aeruginosa]
MSIEGIRISPRKQRIIEIADQIIEGQVSKGVLDPENEQAMDAAITQAVTDAAALYDAAIEFMS